MLAPGGRSPSPTPGVFNSAATPTRQHLLSGSRSPSSDTIQLKRPGRIQSSPPNGLVDDAALADVKVHYCSQVYEAVVIAIQQSLQALINMIDWRQGQTDRY